MELQGAGAYDFVALDGAVAQVADGDADAVCCLALIQARAGHRVVVGAVDGGGTGAILQGVTAPVDVFEFGHVAGLE